MIAIVTGAAQGIGRGVALELARQGADVAVADLDETRARQVAAEISTLGRRSLPLKVDVTSKPQMDEMVARVVAEFGPLDLMVNNAGIGHVAPFLELSEADWDRVFSVNAKGTLFGVQAAARAMIKQNVQGRIVNIASVAGKGGRPLLAAYAASKASVINLTQSAAYALAPYKITVNCLCPGVVATQLGQVVLRQMKAYTDAAQVGEDQSRVPPAPLGPEATPEDVGRMVVYLAGQGGAYITGQSINIDGGRCMH